MMYLFRATILVLLHVVLSQAQPQSTCKSVVCPTGERCFMVQVQCITSPCPPLPMCIADPCQAPGVCGPGLTCQVNLCNGRPCGHGCKNLQDYTCPNPSGIITPCVITPDNCFNDSKCNGPWEKCCPHGCGSICKPRVLNPCRNHGWPIVDTSGKQLFCGRGPTHVDCPTGSSCVIHPTDVYAVCCPAKQATCGTVNCARDELCYMKAEIQCVTTPCPPPVPVCYTNPCKTKCPWNPRCFLVNNGCNGYCMADAHCPRVTSSGYSRIAASMAGLMVMILIAVASTVL